MNVLQTRGVVAAVALAGLSACASGPAFRASWYLDPDPPTAGQPPGIYLALLNEGRDKVRLSQVVVNPEGGAGWPPLIVGRSAGGTGQMVILPPKTSAGSKAADDARSIEQKELADARQTTDQEALDRRHLNHEPRLIARDWLPGQLLVFRVRDKDADRPCSLPVLVRVRCGEGCAGTQVVSGVLPNYLHAAWIDACNAVELAQP